MKRLIIDKLITYFSRSFAQLRATFEEYQKVTKKDIVDAIKADFSGDMKKAVMTIGKLKIILQ